MKLESITKAGFYHLEEETVEQPFPAGTGGCESFRIPGLITLADGSLFATSDARWTHPDEDCGGIDTIYAVSNDGGAHWRPGYAAYFPDSLGSPNNLSDATTCIDSLPVQTTDGVIHVFVDLGPTGVATAQKWPNVGSGCITEGGKRRLALTGYFADADNAPEQYPYYVGDFDGDFAPIIKRPNLATGYAIDSFFNLYRRTGDAYEPLRQTQIDTGRDIVQNIFYRDSLFHVYNTMYTLHLYSADQTRTWRCELVDDAIKLPEESALLAAPGNGVVTADGRTVLPFYAMHDGKSASFLVFSDDDCKTFYRSAYLPATDAIPWSGECKPVELPNGDIRLFFRNDVRRICYADYSLKTRAWSAPVALPVLVHSDCNFAALARGNQILISYARGVGAEAANRSHGRVYVFQLDAANAMILSDVVPVTDGAFSYAVLTETDGGVGVLYDTCGDGIVIYKEITLP